MKKKLLLAGAMLLLAAAAVTGFAAYERSNVSDLLDANVEALADDETISPAYEVGGYCETCHADVSVCFPCATDEDCGSCRRHTHQ